MLDEISILCKCPRSRSGGRSVGRAFVLFSHNLNNNNVLSSQVMANLNFQQPPRIPSASLSRSTNSGFTSNSISGNVTPTSSLMFQSSQQPVSNSSYVTAPGQQQNQQPNQQQLSPNRGGGMAIVAPPMGSRRMFNPTLQQRDEFNTRRMAGGLGGGSMNMGSFMQSGRYGQSGGLNNFQSVFASSSDTPPTLLDMSEFPSLTNARQNDQHSSVLQAPGSKPYGKLAKNGDSSSELIALSFTVGMVKQPTSEQTEFQMSSEDFPALPGTSDNLAGVVGSGASAIVGNQSHQSASASSVMMSGNNVIGSGGHHHHHQMSSLGGMMNPDGSNMMDNKNSIGSNLCMDMMQSETVVGHQVSVGGHHHLPSEKAKRGVQTSPNGLVTNIPPTMVNNQYGMIGLLTFIRAAESDPNLVSLAMGQDLTALGLNLNSMENLYQSFGGPFSDGSAR